MALRPSVGDEERRYLYELVEAVDNELRSGKPPAAVATELMRLGFCRRSARRLVATIAGAGRKKGRPWRSPGVRLGIAGLIGSLALLVGFACIATRQFGFTLWVALAALAASVGETAFVLRSARLR